MSQPRKGGSSNKFTYWSINGRERNHLELIGSINEEGVGKWIHVKPVSIVLNLKASNSILYEEGEEAVIGMCRDAHGKFWLWTRRIEVGGKELKAWFPIHCLLYVAFFES